MAGYDPLMFQSFEGIDRDKFMLALFSMKARTTDILDLAQALVIEQTTGTWTAIPEETREVKERSMGRVLGVYEIPDWEKEMPPEAVGQERTVIILAAFPIININGQFPEMLTVLYGNISMIGKLKLLDVFMPPALVGSFAGPKFGIKGVRDILGVQDRPILCAMYKPCVGALPGALAKMAYELALGGVEVLKDDELLADPNFCTVEERIAVTEKALEKARKETGKKVLYTVNVTDRPDRMFEKARQAVKSGVSALMVNVYSVGYGAMQAIAEDPAITVPILGHPSFAGTFFESPDYGLTSHLVLGKFARMSGVDMIIYPSPYGKVPLMRERAIRVAQELTSPMGNLKPVFPGPAAGMHPGTVAISMRDFGKDLIIGAGGGIHGHPGGAVAGGKAFHQAIDAALKGEPVAEAAKKHPELRTALDKWGDAAEGRAIYSLLK